MTRTEILRRYGIVDRPNLQVRPTLEADILRKIAINGPGDPLTAPDGSRARALAEELKNIGETELAAEIVGAANSAKGGAYFNESESVSEIENPKKRK
jgi:hypothetical protein